jgi:hypothetical protein
VERKNGWQLTEYAGDGSQDGMQRLLAELADRAYDEVLFLPLFETPVIYALDSELNSSHGLTDGSG